MASDDESRRVRRFRTGRAALRRDIDDEIDFHLERIEEEMVAAGMERDEARAEARRRFGSVESYRRQCRRIGERRRRAERTGEAVTDLWMDLKFALRSFRKTPGFVAVAVLTLALGIAGNANIFGMVYGLVLAPLPYGDAEELVIVWSALDGDPDRRSNNSLPDWADYRRGNETLEDIVAFTPQRLNLTGEGEPARVYGYRATPNLLDVLQVEPAIGRPFIPEDADEGAPPVVILSDRLWTRLGSDPDLVGDEIRLDGVDHTVIGVMPDGFEFPQFQFIGDLWTPLQVSPEDREERRGRRWVSLVGRLRDGVEVEQAQADLARIAEQLAADHPETNARRGAYVVGLHDQMSEPMRPALVVMFATVGFVLLICCVNVANLLLARGSSRASEVAIRASLGASRGRIVRQLLTESLLLALLGGAAGWMLSQVTGRLLQASLPDVVSRIAPTAMEAEPHVGILLFTFAVALLAGLIFGVVPAFRAARSDFQGALRAGSGGIAGERRKSRLRGLLVVGEVAMSVVLVAGAGLLAKGFVELTRLDPGFDPDGVLTLSLALPEHAYPGSDDLRRFADEMLAEVRGIEGVVEAGATSLIPLSMSNSSTTFAVEGRPEPAPGEWPRANYRWVTPGYLEAMRIPLRRGRLLDDRDRADATPVAVINESLAGRYWPDADPLGKRFRFSGSDEWIEVVGLVGDIRHDSLMLPPAPEMYLPYAQGPDDEVVLAVRTAGEPLSLAAAVRERIWSVDSRLPIADVRSMASVVDDSAFVLRLPTYFMGAFAVVALVLAAVGLYGVLAFLVAQRRQELGVRQALGAGRLELARLVVGRALFLAGVGVLLGSVGAFFLGQVLGSLLQGVSGDELTIYVGVPVLMLLVSVAASWVPARRALGIDPVISLRAE